MLPLGLFASRQFSAANAVTFVVYAALGGLLFLVPPCSRWSTATARWSRARPCCR